MSRTNNTRKKPVNHKLLILTILIPLTIEKESLVDPHERYIPYPDTALRDPCITPQIDASSRTG